MTTGPAAGSAFAALNPGTASSASNVNVDDRMAYLASHQQADDARRGDDHRLGHLLEPREDQPGQRGDRDGLPVAQGSPAKDEGRTRDGAGRRGGDAVYEGTLLVVVR